MILVFVPKVYAKASSSSSPSSNKVGIGSIFTNPSVAVSISQIPHLKSIKKDRLWNKYYDINTKSY